MSHASDDALTTDDLARPRHKDPTGAGSRPGDQARRSGPPVLPGEATDRLDAGTAASGAVSGARGEVPGAAGSADATEPATAEEHSQPLLGPGRTADLRTRWSTIQNDFVDDPQEAVRAADALVAEVMQTLAATFARHKQGLEEQWHKGGGVATEDLRLALQHYRSFFKRLLST